MTVLKRGIPGSYATSSARNRKKVGEVGEVGEVHFVIRNAGPVILTQTRPRVDLKRASKAIATIMTAPASQVGWARFLCPPFVPPSKQWAKGFLFAHTTFTTFVTGGEWNEGIT